MISVEKAKDLLMKHVMVLPPVSVPVEAVVGNVLAEDVVALVDLPPFDQSAMDGYALIADGKSKAFSITGEIKAGDVPKMKMKKGEAVRIFTGAALPGNADSIILQEGVKADLGKIILSGIIPKKGDNIRYKGSQTEMGERALKKKTLLNPAATGFLASMGYRMVKVFRKPVISIVVTGNELQQGNEKLQRGKIYESNSVMLSAALQQMNIKVKNVGTAADKKNELENLLQKFISNSDIVIVSGGISAGKYDLVKEVLMGLGVKEIFWKVAQKPGKPLFAGKKNDALVFALPGNPAASLCCFYEYVFPAIKKMQGFEDCFLPGIKLPLAQKVHGNRERAVFLKGKISGKKVLPLEGQESYMLKSFAEADCLIYLKKGKRYFDKGEKAEVHLLPKN